MMLLVNRLFFPYGTVFKGVLLGGLLFCLALGSVNAQEQAVLDQIGELIDEAWSLTLNNSDSALILAEAALALADSAQLPAQQAQAYEAIGLYHEIVNGDIQQASEAYFKGVEVCEVHQLDYIADLYHTLGILYHSTDNYKEGKQFYERALVLTELQNDTLLLKKCLANLGAVCSSLEEYERAIELLKRSNAISLRPDINYINLANLGHLYTKLEDYKQAIVYLEQATEIHPDNPNADGNLYFLLHAKAKAKDSTNMKVPLERAMNLVENEAQGLRDRSLLYRNIADYLTFTGDYKKALAYRNKYIEVFEEIKENHRDEIVLEMERKYATEKREQEVKVLRLEAKQKEQRSRFYGVLAIAGLCMAALIGFFLYKNREKNDLLIRQNLQLEDNVKEINLLLREIHHRVKNNLQVVTSLLNIQQRSIVDEKAREAIRESKNRIQSMGLIHQSFYQNKNLGEINTQVYIQDLVNQVMASYPTDQTSIQLKVDVQEIYLDMDTLVPLGLIINELLTNALKHAFNAQETGTLAVRFGTEVNNYRLEVEDDGVGVDDETLSKSSKSFGFSLIQAFVQKLEGSLQVLRTKGTCFQIDFPA